MEQTNILLNIRNVLMDILFILLLIDVLTQMKIQV